jgi:clan AA aspartic protease (TIGR02281 family)
MMRKTTIQLLSIVTLVIFGTGVSSAEMVYKCKNAQGKMLYQKTPCAENAQAVNSWTPKTKVKLPDKEEPTKKVNEIIVIPQGAGGHYFLDAEVNSHSLTFIVDTGATTVALPRAVAASASLFCNEKALLETGNGRTGGCTTIITELKLGKGNLVLKNVPAVIMPNLNQPLLGMNVLQHFNIEQKNNEMQLSAQNAK